MMDAPESGDGFTTRVNRNSESAAAELDGRYRQRLCALVAREMGQRFRAREDPEDVSSRPYAPSLGAGRHDFRSRIPAGSGSCWLRLPATSS